MPNRVPSGSTEAMLQGQAAGVTVINSGAPGGASNVRIRGITSIRSSDPARNHRRNTRQPSRPQYKRRAIYTGIKRGAGAASLYGVRGSNGLIIVTTREGRSGKVRLSYDAFFDTRRPLTHAFDLANPTETATLYGRNI